MNGLNDFIVGQYKSAADFALEIGVTVGCVNHWLNGRRTPEPTTALRIAKLSKGRVPFEGWYKQPIKQNSIPAAETSPRGRQIRGGRGGVESAPSTTKDL